jgi:hypothetical protein
MNREHEVMAELRRSRVISSFWLCDPGTRWNAFWRLEKRGVISVKNIGYPCYKVTIHRHKQEGAHEGNKIER